ncbi:SDR family NAD(P)-dependent oxidoreductase [Pseudochelatococcus sp. B33]
MIVLPDIDERVRDWARSSPLTGLIAAVAGGGSGIGEAVAHTFAANGVHVLVADKNEEAAQRVCDAIIERGGKALACGMDVARTADIETMTVLLSDRFGGLDLLVNAAGIIQPASLETCPMGQWRKSFEVNVEGALLLARGCLPLLRKSDAPSIVNVASLAGGRAYPGGGPYGVSKAALIHLTKTMAVEWASDGIRVNVVSPGSVLTPLLLSNMSAETRTQRERQTPLGRMGKAPEIADLIVYLSSPMASYITAQEIECDGGFSQSLMVQKFRPL